MAAQYILLAAEFVAATQVLVYIGAIVVLFLFGIMLTRAKLGARPGPHQQAAGRSAAATALLLFGVMAYALIDEFGWNETPLPADPRITTVERLQHRHRERLDLLHLPRAVRGRVRAPARRPRGRHRPGPEGLSVDDLLLNQFLLLGAVLFCLGVYGVLARSNAVLVLMSIELILNAVNINLIAFGAMHGAVAGSVFALFVIAIAAAEVGVGPRHRPAHLPQPPQRRPRRRRPR